jgi:2-dehydropantoate 2-reductase
LRVRWLNHDRGWTTWDRFGVHVEPTRGWDAVLLTMASDALAASWLEPLGRATGDATVAVLQPGLRDFDKVAEVIAPERLVRGMIGLIAFHCPLEGDPRFQEEGVAWWFAPLVKTLFQGDRARPLVEGFARGKMPAGLTSDVGAKGGFGSAALIPHIAALECAGWSFAGLRNGPWLKVASDAAREVAGIVEDETGASRPLGLGLVSPVTAGLASRVLPSLVPFDLEAYVRAHFTKVGTQTRAILAANVEAGRHKGLPVAAIEALSAELATR